MAVMPYEGLYIGFPLILNPAGTIPPPHDNFTGLNQTELALSRDLHHWERVAERAIFLGIEPWDGENFDTAQIMPVGRPLVRDDEIWILHNAIRYRGLKEHYLAAGHDYTADELSSINLARLRLDGFVSLDAADQGSITTRPFEAAGGDLRINADASQGQVEAVVIDAETQKALPGQSGAMMRDSLNEVVVENIAIGRPLRVRFTLHNASLYSFWIGK